MIMMRPLDNDEPTPVATPGVIFATAGEAANYLRLLRETDSKPTYVVRRSLMKTPPRNPR
jgi:hypothetical protein